ncbi:hypothetical protein ACIOHE_39110 [Streptomyces sp. NPDC087851]|uniref:hypothetical protein n=1 Tax=Streptomyces sp. NPDC087851 TaxID=3365810 RepID=UPI00381A583C
MARIRILEAVAGADFSWLPGDIVDLPEEQAAVWADGHRAVRADYAPGGTSVLGLEDLAPVVTTVDGAALRVVGAEVEEVDVPGADGESLAGVRWSVTVALPDPESESETRPAPDPDPGPDVFDPGEHISAEVLAYLQDATEEEALRVLDAEAAGQNRAGIGKQRDGVLARARARDEGRADGRQEAAEKAAEVSRGGGRSDGIETR